MPHAHSQASYMQNELMSATEVARNFGSVVDSLVSKKKQKVGVLRKNKLEVVIMPVKEYQKITELQNILEEYELYKEILRRSKTPSDQFIKFEDILKKHNIKL